MLPAYLLTRSLSRCLSLSLARCCWRWLGWEIRLTIKHLLSATVRIETCTTKGAMRLLSIQRYNRRQRRHPFRTGAWLPVPVLAICRWIWRSLLARWERRPVNQPLPFIISVCSIGWLQVVVRRLPTVRSSLALLRRAEADDWRILHRFKSSYRRVVHRWRDTSRPLLCLLFITDFYFDSKSI